MKLLLDTHVFLWSVLEPERIARRVARALADPGAELWLSPVSVWETLVLCRKGRIDLRPNAQGFLDTALSRVPLRDAPLTRAVALASESVALPHGDPADRFLVATAVTYGLTLVTADRRLLAAKGVRMLANR